jgi:hypothetical protein
MAYNSMDINCLTHNPLQTSRLGDLGYVDEGGRWRTVVNIVDEPICQKFGMQAIQISHSLENYITEKKYEPFDVPFVRLLQGGNYQILTPDQLAQYVSVPSVLIFRMINPQSQPLLERPSSEARASELGLFISPLPNMTTVAFITGPHIIVRQLHFQYSVVDAWLRTYRSKIDKAARKAIKQNPLKNNSKTMYITLSEFCTESWRTIFIRTNTNPSPVALGWRTAPGNEIGGWGIIELPNSKSVISGGMGSVPVFSQILTLRLIYLIEPVSVDICKYGHSCKNFVEIEKPIVYKLYHMHFGG